MRLQRLIWLNKLFAQIYRQFLHSSLMNALLKMRSIKSHFERRLPIHFYGTE